MDGYVFVKDLSDNWSEIGVESLKRYKKSGYDTEALLDKVIEYNGLGGAYLNCSVRDGDQHYIDYFSPTLRARIYIDRDDPLNHQFYAKDFDTLEEKHQNRTDLMKRVIAIIYESGEITKEQYLAEIEYIEAKPGYNSSLCSDYQILFMNFTKPYGDESYDGVIDIR